MAKYFTDKPDDVTCATCPYWERDESLQHKGEGLCRRHPLSVSRRHNQFSGEHPWFVAEREELKARNQPDFDGILANFNNILSDRFHDLAQMVSP